MIKQLRLQFNDHFAQEKYDDFLEDINTALDYPSDFRISETPLFISRTFRDELIKACDDILAQLQTPEFTAHCATAIPPGLAAPNETGHPLFLQLDFAVTKNKDKWLPKLIELQGFPSIYAFQYFFPRILQKHFRLTRRCSPYLSGINAETYLKVLGEAILGGHDPREVVLLEIQPELQKTRIDFSATERLFGVKHVCILDVFKDGRQLFYKDPDGTKLPIKRIYNRVIVDELFRKNIQPSFSFTDELDVEWAGHPNWFFKISKHSLPFLRGEYVPESYFLSGISQLPVNLADYVLKPLYSFAGLGVEVELTPERLAMIEHKEQYILQQKVNYADTILTPDGYAKCEIRMMFIWQEKPVLVNNLVRMSKGKMMGVDFNKNKTWVGSSCALIGSDML